MNMPIEKKIAYMIREKGGKAYYVGGFVRDKILGKSNKDIDIEVHGISAESLIEILKSFGEPLSFGSSFGIYSLRGFDIDIAMPRKEHATGRGHRDFEVFVDPFIGETEAARRRDFTMNALMEDVLTGEILDPFGGLDNLKNGLIRHIDDSTFVEDPLRVFRAAQFAARFNFRLADETAALCKTIDTAALSRERIEEELKKALLKSEKPSTFFDALKKMEQLDTWFPEIKSLIGLKQDKIFHPEGDVYIHTMQALDRAAKYRDEATNPYAFMLLALTHDLGKIITTEEKDGRIHAYMHEVKGLPIIEKFLRRITGEKIVKEYVLNMVEHHMKPNVLALNNSALKSSNKMFDSAYSAKDLMLFAFCDKEPSVATINYLKERYEKYEELMARPYVMGKDLIDAGLVPGEYFSDVLSYAHKLRLAGIDKENALKQTLAYARKYM